MHMSDALISTAVGGTMWAASAGLISYSTKKVHKDLDDKKIPLMGVMGAFVFAAQMINFSIPGTGSSGHLGGGLLLAILLGPYAGFLTMTSILTIQALFFADGGLLSLGCNIFNLGFYTCFIAYPLIYKPMMREGYSSRRSFAAILISSVIGLQLGAFSVVLETLLSGKTELPFITFTALMQPIHLGIGIMEGLVTAAVIAFVWKARPEIMESTLSGETLGNLSLRKVLSVLAVSALVIGIIFSWFASSHPDGLEWSIMKASGKEELEAPAGVHQTLAGIQEKTAFLPDYDFKTAEDSKEDGGTESPAWPAVSGGTSASGLIGGLLTLLLAAVTGLIINMLKRNKKEVNA